MLRFLFVPMSATHIITTDGSLDTEVRTRPKHALAPYASVPKSWFQKFYVNRMQPAQLIVGLRLCFHADERGECYPGVSYLTEVTGLRERTIYRAMAWLEAHGL